MSETNNAAERVLGYVAVLSLLVFFGFLVFWRLMATQSMQVASQTPAAIPDQIGPLPVSTVTSKDIALHAVTSDRIANNTIVMSNLSPAVRSRLEKQPGAATLNVGLNLPGLPDVSVEQLLRLLGLQGADVNQLLAGATSLANLPPDVLDVVNNLTGAVIDSPKIIDGSIQGVDIAVSTLTGNLLADGTIGTANIANGAVTNALLASNSVNAGNIIDAAISTADIASGAITSTLLAGGAVGTGNIANNAITSSLIATNAVGSAQIADSSVGSGEIIDAAITTADITSGAITNPLLASSSVGTSNIISGAITNPLIASGAVGTSNIAAGAITNGLIASGAVDTGNITSGAITNALLATNSVSASNIVNGTISTADIASGAITGTLIASGTVGTSNLATGAITSTLIADGAVGLNQLADGAISSAKIVDGTISTADIASGAIDSTRLANGSVLTSKLSTAANTKIVSVQVGDILASLLSPAEWPVFVAPSNGTITKVTFTTTNNVSTGATKGSISLLRKASATTVGSTSLVTTPLTAFTANVPALVGGQSFSTGDVYSLRYAPGILGVNLSSFLVTIEYTPSE